MTCRTPLRGIFAGLGRERLPGTVFSLVLAAAAAPSAHADANAGSVLAHQGSAGVPACVSCHGMQGEGQAASGFPRLAGQNQDYLLKQLQAFADGTRKSPQMNPIARALSAAQKRDATAYFASLPAWKQQDKPDTSSPSYQRGRKLATVGDWNKEMPACFICHGAGGRGVPPHFPALAGQPRTYTRVQLEAWRSAKRSNDPQGLMRSVGAKMTDQEIADVSLYLENPSPAEVEE